jgi:hypothetical protein
VCRRGAACRSGCGHMADGSGAEPAVHGTAGFPVAGCPALLIAAWRSSAWHRRCAGRASPGRSCTVAALVSRLGRGNRSRGGRPRGCGQRARLSVVAFRVRGGGCRAVVIASDGLLPVMRSLSRV